VAVEHDFLHVHFGPAHAQAVRAGEILAGHPIGLLDKSRQCYRGIVARESRAAR
jgi:hypothetical protein